MKNSISLFLSVVPALTAFSGCSQGADKTTEKPLNIVYIMTDDHSYQTLSAYDTRYIQTPNMDRLATEGLRFTNSFVANSLSGPSRACLMTGKHSHANGFINNRSTFDGSQQTFIKLLTQAGYQTAIIGKWHLVSEPQGFTFWDILPGQGAYYNPDFINAQGTYRETGYVTDVITDKGIDWLSKRDKTKPFCLLLHHKATHRNWQSPIENLNEFEDKTFPIPETFWDDYATREAAKVNKMSVIKDMRRLQDLKVRDTLNGNIRYAGDINRMGEEEKEAWKAFYDIVSDEFYEAKREGKELAEWQFQRYMRDYLKCVRSVDDNIGRVLDYLEKEGLLENTLVVYASDQGFYMGEHGWFDKRFMYEESLRTPLLMRLPDNWKKAKRGTDVTQMVQNIDYAPTFLELAGVPVPEDIQGVSLVPLLKGKSPKNWRKSIYYHYYEYPDEHNVHPHYGVRTDRYKLIHFYEDMDAWELFDMQEDPNELHNVYNDPAYASVQKDMHQQLDQLRIQYQDNGPKQ